jgi:hypothetical protein
MRIPILETIGGNTLRLTWVSSGDTASPISSALYDGAETLISSVAATSSGNGFYYAPMRLPTSMPWYVNEWIAVINASTYVSRQLVRVHRWEVDQ